MKSSILGLLAGIFIIGYVIAETSDNAYLYLNYLSILIVFGGTVSAAIITHGLSRIYEIFKMFFKAFTTAKYSDVVIVEEIIAISQRMFKDESIENIIEDDIHPYVKDGLKLIVNKFSTEKIVKISKTMLHQRYTYYEDSVERLEVLAKYPPAFGMMGTIIGLIAVMKKMSVDSGIEGVGPSMAVALVTTLYGIFIANYVIHPICDNLRSRSKIDIKVRRIISEGIILLNNKEDPIFVREVLTSYLLPSERVKFDKRNQHTGQQRKAAA